MERIGQAQKEYSLHEEGLYKTKDIASRTFYRPDKDSSSFPLYEGPVSLVRATEPRIRSRCKKSVIFQIPHLPQSTAQATKTCSICTLTARQD